ncbi:hypothetical protein, partial [Burkholderia cepacia]|uniref:hypothetical protein n=1 Tax=Burkholderia cepacia TaxID=292 RepID=UPI002ABD201E
FFSRSYSSYRDCRAAQIRRIRHLQIVAAGGDFHGNLFVEHLEFNCLNRAFAHAHDLIVAPTIQHQVEGRGAYGVFRSPLECDRWARPTPRAFPG